jgi:KDO2-lipid IV(A) lauroyltransferase
VATTRDVAGGAGRTENRGTLRQRAGAGILSALSWLACRLPEGPQIRLAELGGELWYRLDTRRAARARRNLRRVAGWLAARELGHPLARAAADDPAALERLVRSAFRHYARYYLDLARAPSYTPAYLAERVPIEQEDNLREAFGGGPAIFIGLHFGAIELQAYVAAVRSHRPLVTPMETIDDPALQRYFVRTRGSIGIRIVGLREARRELAAALRRGEAVGVVADRDLTGGGMPATLFGAPTSLPLGPALLAVETGAPTWLTSVRRAAHGRYVGRIERLAVPAEGSRRERVSAFLEAEARAFEREIALAPEQWWAVFFPIWPDLETAAAA